MHEGLLVAIPLAEKIALCFFGLHYFLSQRGMNCLERHFLKLAQTLTPDYDFAG